MIIKVVLMINDAKQEQQQILAIVTIIETRIGRIIRTIVRIILGFSVESLSHI